MRRGLPQERNRLVEQGPQKILVDELVQHGVLKSCRENKEIAPLTAPVTLVNRDASDSWDRKETYACAVPNTLVMMGRFSPRPWNDFVLSIRATIPFRASSMMPGSSWLEVLVSGRM